jgi:hypothetical protein
MLGCDEISRAEAQSQLPEPTRAGEHGVLNQRFAEAQRDFQAIVSLIVANYRLRCL